MTKKQRTLEIIERLKKEYPDAACTLDYDQAWKLLVSVRLAAQCTDARVNVVVEGLFEKYPSVEALAAADEGKPYWLVLPFSEGTPRIRREITEGRGHCRILEENGQKLYAEEFCYDGRVYIFGGGHLAQELVPVLSHLGFWCMVLDDREEYTDHALFPGVQETKTVDFTALSQILEVKPEDYLVVVTRGHRCDADVERFALRTPASYIGVVGSKRKTRYVREKLASEGFTEEELDQVYAPIGIEIESETPAEIAISIAAQLIQIRADKTGMRRKKE